MLGGDHSLAAGSVSGVAEFYRRKGQKIGIIWIDAHSDINTPRHRPPAMCMACPWRRCSAWARRNARQHLRFLAKVEPENVVLIGMRDIDAAEKENIKRAGIAEVYTMRDIDERGMRTVMEEALRAAGRGTAGYHVSLDMDWIDPKTPPASARQCAAAPPIAKPIWPWRSSPTTAACSASRSSK